MGDFSIWALLSMAFALGMVHALDADHVAAVSGLSCKTSSWKSSAGFCARWALGHGGALLLIGVPVLFLGMAIPDSLSAWAENLVGLVLILIGAWVLWDLSRTRAHLHFHAHDHLPEHAHWHRHDANIESHGDEQHRHNHTPVMVGVLHGVAGSAPLLAILPLTQMTSPWTGLFYLLLFGCGVFVAMLLFGGALGGLFMVLHRWGDRFVTLLRLLVGLVSIGLGLHLLQLAVA
jgi:ABC-type nickel/cobalt efflux system permease component RcnA